MSVNCQISVYAAYLYDAVFLYAQALTELLKNAKSPREEAAILVNGTAIINKLRGRSYTGEKIVHFQDFLAGSVVAKAAKANFHGVIGSV